MPRNPMQDIVPKGGKSIRNIPVPESRIRPSAQKHPAKPKKEVPAPDLIREEIFPKRSINILDEEEEKAAVRPPVRASSAVKEELDRPANWETLEEVRKEFEASSDSQEYEIVEKKRRKRGWGIFALILAVLLAGFGLSSLFDSATVVLVPQTVSAAVESGYTAKKSPGGELSYEAITLKETASETVKATGERKVDRKATGTIVIYNNYTSSTQRLIKNTRFATPEGLIFRITESVTVPGKKGSTPGSIEATVVADAAGDSYNVGLKDFTIPGFKGDPRYTAFYARGKTPIAGGFSGTEKVIADADRANAKTAIEAKITEELLRRAPTLVASDKVTFDKAYKIAFAPLPEESSGSEVTLRSEGTLSFAVFDKKQMSEAVAKAHIKEYKGEPIQITNLGALTFSPKGAFDPAGSDSIAFSLAGDAQFEWEYDELALKQALLGQSRGNVTEILEKFPTIKSADISLRPAWSRSFPDSLEKITIEKAK